MDTHIKQDECHHEAKVSPMVGVFNIETGPEELIRCAGGTELAGTFSVWVGEITACPGDVALHVAST